MTATHEIPAMHQYNTMKRFSSYWTQIDETLRAAAPGSRVLEIGMGTGLTAWYLEKAGLEVMTADLLASRGPTVAADVRNLPFADGSFEAIVAFQILEHIPFDQFTPVLKEFARISRHGVIISLPDNSAKVTMALTMPKLGSINHVWRLPFYARKSASKGIGHQWEIGIKDFPVSRIVEAIEASGLKLVRHYSLKENPYHYFFVLEK
jgi:ubiquinone/menaquinone biosynthesis C-methylase UbiE